MFFFSRSAVDILISHHHGKHLLAASSHELHEHECMLDPMMIWSVAKTCRERDCNRYELILLVGDSRQWLTDCCASKQGPISLHDPCPQWKERLFFHSQHALYILEVPSFFHYTGAATVHEVTVKLLVILRCMRVALCIHCRCRHMTLLS